jgi:hypothetical protein
MHPKRHRLTLEQRRTIERGLGDAGVLLIDQMMALRRTATKRTCVQWRR